MTPIDIQVKGQAYSLYDGEGGISVLQTSIFHMCIPCDKAFHMVL